ncbi:hypothetical protein [Mesorhizobium japonicum]|uniref:Mlr6551 protein n=1 Tax=Mesorhizobium japonicum (strain LMG 29417 / CECT 9101 / MAFF 303099) TaxID=266835 RepID=Q988X6_RHILO|nr:hypothetical protein [Mesorhizobium japonicum]BAB52821.1 mlr6551 [Mesorhizobium japonicum MAFF 303099]
MNAHPGFQTEIEFELPKGYVDGAGTLHRQGVMRLATAADEILPLRDPRVQENEAYLSVIVLARVIVRLGSLKDVHPGVIEGLYASDLAYLQRLYETFNSADEPLDKAVINGGSNGVRSMVSLGEA